MASSFCPGSENAIGVLSTISCCRRTSGIGSQPKASMRCQLETHAAWKLAKAADQSALCWPAGICRSSSPTGRLRADSWSIRLSKRSISSSSHRKT